MAACIDPVVWQQAVSDCQAISSVRGLGAPNYKRTGLRGLRGFGATLSATLAPTSIANLFTSASMNTAVTLPAAPAPPTGYKTNAPAPPSGTTQSPCALIANGNPCQSQGTCPTGFSAVSVGPGETNCLRIVPALTAPTPATPGAGPALTATMTPAPAAATAGFSHWGLLAALAVGGFVVYKVATHKKSAS